MKWLPARLPDKSAILWTRRMSSPALAGVAATRDAVIVADRDPADRVDIFRRYSADGQERWTLRYPARGNLDYGNSSRSTPLIDGDLAILAGAHGHVHAVDLATGDIRWKKHLQKDFQGAEGLSWGFCASPLLVDGKLILQPGGAETALVALEPATGKTVWRCAGRPPGHSSFVIATFGNRKQIIGYDNETLGGWDPVTGKRLWTLTPEHPGDFNVPTPMVWEDKLIVATESNGARIYAFDAEGSIIREPLAKNQDMVPDCHSPVQVNGRLFGISDGLFCLNARDGLKNVWSSPEAPYQEYASLIASNERLLVTTLRGRLILVNAQGDKYEKLSELQLFDEEAGLYSHPAVVGRRLYVRGSNSLSCLNLDDQQPDPAAVSRKSAE